jgi:hypothetical protein
MRSLVLLLAGLTLAPAVVVAQDDSTPPRERERGRDDRARDRDRDRDRCNCGLREVSNSRRGGRREGFFAAVGLGGGSESFDANDGLGWSNDKGGVTGYIKVGGTVSQSLLLGAELNGWAARYQRQGYDRSLGSLMFIAQWYPGARSDFWLRGGAGWARDNLSLYGTSGDITRHENGTALALGFGYDFRVARNVSITPTLDLQGQRYDSHDERLISFGVGVTFH